MKSFKSWIFALTVVFFVLPGQSQADPSSGKVPVEVSEDPYLYDWRWEARPDSLARIPRAPSSLNPSWASEDQPLRVQRHLPRYRHFRSAAQIHWEIQEELALEE